MTRVPVLRNRIFEFLQESGKPCSCRVVCDAVSTRKEIVLKELHHLHEQGRLVKKMQVKEGGFRVVYEVKPDA